ncbi:hypothetical protein ESCO_005001 [Escovopsis weberi]|uniref:Inner kinetochore subunit AME1 domain-containing protein n=1 Tax=Escovopsis weberi TaxID=150374 RepID=A0A0M8MYM3_ESCWE|nr:hypothetical protein ESCO_005001 [Escovopsis weberi]
MATGREGRAERLNERLRGAQRANVEESFSLDLDGLDIPGSTSPAADEAPASSSSNGAHPYSDAISAALHTPGSSARRRSRRLGPRDPYDLRETSKELSSPPPYGNENENEDEHEHEHEHEGENGHEDENENEATPTPMDRDDATPRDVTTAKAGTRVSTIARSAVSRRLDPVPDELETLPTPAYVRTPFEVTSSPGERMSEDVLVEEVAESPAHAPGSGKRRLALPANGETGYTARNLGAISSDRSVPASSSPSERRARRGDSFSMRGSVMSVSRLDLLPEVDEAGNGEPERRQEVLQPLGDAEPVRRQNGDAGDYAVADVVAEDVAMAQDAQPGEASFELIPELGLERHLELGLGPELEAEPEPEPEQQTATEEHEGKAEKNAKDKNSEKQQQKMKEDQRNGKQDDAAPADQQEAALTEAGEATEAPRISKKKRGRPPRQKSPELGSVSAEEKPQEEVEQPIPKRRRQDNDRASRRQPPVIQRAAKPRSKPESPSQAQEDEGSGEEESQAKKTKPRRRRRAKDADEDGEGGGDGMIEVTVQRFVHHKRRGDDGDGDDDDEADPLHADIPFANRGGESVVDALAQVCDEIITSTLAQFRETAADATSDVAKKKECRIKMRAIEAFREELNSRLLSHVIHLNHWHSLRRRLRHLQKEKMALRTGILSIRSEREQVALRMDAIRIKHEADTKESKYCLDASTLMHDIDLAVEQGRNAPEVSGKEQREAELANLELLVSRISQEASSAHATGGLLKQVQDFNAFLERAAIALETR